MNKTVILVVLFLVFFQLNGIPKIDIVESVLADHYYNHPITIEGDEKYRHQVKKCLNLLASKADEEYEIIVNHVGIISQNNRSGMRAWETPPRFEMSNKTAFHSIAWCSGSIAHDSYHSLMYQENLPINGKRPPYNSWAGFSAERKAIEFQIAVMEKIEASSHEIEHLKSQDGTHADVNGDGKITGDDYKERNW